MEEYIEIFEKLRFFSYIDKEDILDILICIDAKCIEYEKDSIIVASGNTVKDISIILSGQACTVKNEPSGKDVIVSLLNEGSYIGILLASDMNRRSPVSIRALSKVLVISFPIEKVMNRCSKLCPRHNILLSNLLDGISESALHLYERIDCLIKPTVREKILTYLTMVSKEKSSDMFTVPLDRASMAEYLNVERSALSRELSKMKKDGLIDYYKNDFKLICK